MFPVVPVPKFRVSAPALYESPTVIVTPTLWQRAISSGVDQPSQRKIEQVARV